MMTCVEALDHAIACIRDLDCVQVALKATQNGLASQDNRDAITTLEALREHIADQVAALEAAR
jgi:hypothetical protein